MSLATLGGQPVTTCRVSIGAWGVPWQKLQRTAGDDKVDALQKEVHDLAHEYEKL